jgi:hypothetical protein
MVKTNLLDQGLDTDIASAVIDALDEGGYSSVEAIPGLILAIHMLSEFTNDPDLAIREAGDLLDAEPEIS